MFWFGVFLMMCFLCMIIIWLVVLRMMLRLWLMRIVVKCLECCSFWIVFMIVCCMSMLSVVVGLLNIMSCGLSDRVSVIEVC